MIHRSLLVVAFCLSLLTLPAIAQDADPVDVPITKIVLFSSGVGYFERSAELDGPGVATLNFDDDQINDVLKSMIVMDTAEDAMASVNYASREPVERALQSFAIDLSDDPTLSDLLAQVRGAEVTVATPDELTGTILGVETRTQRVVEDGATTILESHVLNLVTADGIQAVQMDDVQSVTLSDEELARELNKALAVLLASRDTNRKPVDVKFEGTGTREVQLGYIVETPVWKTSYRLDLSGDEPRLQGWAIVENTTDTDWEDVSLSLVSGQPISFIQDLYTPLYAMRPTIEPSRTWSLMPKLYDSGLTMEALEAEMEKEEVLEYYRDTAGEREYGTMTSPLDALSRRYTADPFAQREGDPMEIVGSAGAVAELFRFDLAKPITLERKTSAMLPLVDREIAAEKVSIYNSSVNDRHPLNGAYLTNDTELQLLAGPITVFDGDMYAGEAVIDNFPENDKRFISYAVDLDVTIDSTEERTREITAVKVVNGMLVMTSKSVTTTTYAIKNVADKDKTLIIEHWRWRSSDRDGLRYWELVSPTEYEEITPGEIRFRVELPASSEKNFDVAVQFIRNDEMALTACKMDTLVRYSENGEISEAVREAIGAIITRKQAMVTLTEELTRLTTEQAEITAAKAELRLDLEAVEADSQLGQRLMKKLSAQMDRLDELDVAIRDKRDEMAAAQADLMKHINELSID